MSIKIKMEDADFVEDVLKCVEQRKEFNGKAVTLFWSGGVDSTYLLCWLLSHGYEVHTIYCDIKNNSPKTKRERWARDNIRSKLLNIPLLCDHWTHHSTPIAEYSVPSGGFRACLAQAPFWLLSTLLKGDSLPSDYLIAYVNGDDAIYWLPEFKKVISAYQGLLPGKDSVTVQFPLVNNKKSWFYGSMKPLHGLMTWCEEPVLRKNCDCPACKTHRYQLED